MAKISADSPQGSLAHLVESCRPVLSQIPLGCAIADPEFRAVFWNAACERIFGFTEAEVLGKTPGETVVPSAQAGVLRRVHGSVAGDATRTHSDNENVTKDGRVLHCRWHNAPLHSPDGELLGIVSMVLEFTERDRELAATREREAEMRNALDAAPEAMLTLDERGRVQTSNVEAQRLFGYAASDLCGVSVAQLLSVDAWFRDARFDPPDGAHELPGLRSDGSKFTARVSLGHAQMVDRKVFTTIVQDLTKQQLAEQKLQEQRRMEALGRLAGGVAHDINNLLTVILGASSLLTYTIEASPHADQQLDAISDACDRAAGLTAQLLAFSKQQIASPSAVEVNDVVRDSLSLLERIVGERWRLVTRYASDECVVRGDRGQLEQVLMNLVTNARDAMPDGGSIYVETFRVPPPSPRLARPDVSYVGFAVTDTGEGIDPDVQAHIFEPFFTTKEAGKGSGLGLATVYGIVEQAGGRVHVESTVGKGARFEVLLPAVDSNELQSTERRASRAAQPSLGGRSALLVEDDDQVRVTTACMLEELGISVHATADASQALALVALRPFDVVVTDLVMPGMDGGALALELRRTRPDVPVLFVTGYTRDAAFHRGEWPERSRLLPKPFSIDDLSNALFALMADVVDAQHQQLNRRRPPGGRSC
ncbi:MAG TPA: PAS domain S-box protein [Enhygromyxa sp.]|nr:PAS domain S-box protein [Enhygromyxa sp.]